MGNISSKLIDAKESVEKMGVSTGFEGFGARRKRKDDPAKRLRKLAELHMTTQSALKKSSSKKKGWCCCFA